MQGRAVQIVESLRGRVTLASEGCDIAPTLRENSKIKQNPRQDGGKRCDRIEKVFPSLINNKYADDHRIIIMPVQCSIDIFFITSTNAMR